jgi:uncharacterized protein
MFLPVIALGLAAGALTTVAGLGGGQLLVLGIAALTTPHQALLLTAPALLVGNLHRGSMLRGHIVWPTAIAFALGAVPGGIAGGLVASALPAWVVHVLMGVMTLVAVVRALRGKGKPTAVRIPVIALVGSGFLLGAICASSSGAGLLLASILLLTGATGRSYVATAAICAAVLHGGRLIGYGAGGMLSLEALIPSAGLAAAIIAGNLLGERYRQLVPARLEPWIEQGTLVACVVLVIAGAIYSR